MPTRQHAETIVPEFIGRPCRGLLAVPTGELDEIVVLYARVDDLWHRMFVDVEVFSLAQCEPDPDDDLEAGQQYRDLAAELGVLGQVIEDFSFRDGRLDIRFRGGAALGVREVESGAMALQAKHRGGLRILMVEDNEAFAQVVSEQFLRAHAVTVVGSVERDGRVRCEVHNVPDWEGLEKLALFAEEHYGASIIERLDGPDARRSVLAVGKVQIELQHDDPWGNALVA